jgi:hypothetical protein
LYTGVAAAAAAGERLDRERTTAMLHSLQRVDEVIVYFLIFPRVRQRSDSATMMDSVQLCQFYLLFLPTQAPNTPQPAVVTWRKNDDEIS